MVKRDVLNKIIGSEMTERWKRGDCEGCGKEIKGRGDFSSKAAWDTFLRTGFCEECSDKYEPWCND